MSHNWNDYGISWTTEAVNRQAGENASDKRKVGDAEIPVPTDLDKIVEHFGTGVVLGSLNGTSWRVMAQDVARRMLPKGVKGEALREAVYNRLRGIRNATAATVVKEVKVYVLPNGETYSGTDEQEYRSLYAAALVDSGVAGPVALDIANRQELK